MDFISLPYGKTRKKLEISKNMDFDVILPQTVNPHPNPGQAVEEALCNPVDGMRLEDFCHVHSVSIAINDDTRPVPHDALLFPLLNRLDLMGVPKEAISLIIATGTHTPMKQDEFSKILPASIYTQYRVLSHDCDNPENLSFVTTTKRGTPVFVNRHFFEADLKIVIGNIEPHHFMGYSGGAKSASIGLCGRNTISQNHALITHSDSRIGEYESNPMRQEVEEIGDLIHVDYALNAILDKEKRLVFALAGCPRAVMKSGIPLSIQICQTPVHELYDIVVASCGGFPKDINLYQAQKAQTNASLITKDGGTIILIAECTEGIGSKGYETFMQNLNSHEEVIEKFSRSQFELGPHKAFLFSRIGMKKNTLLVSSLPTGIVEKLLLTPSDDLQAALSHALSLYRPPMKIAILPYAVATLPILT